jgi:hypothetical protein
MLAALAIAGCGGGGSDDTILVPPGDGDDGGTGAVTQVTLSTSSAQLPTSGNASATITAVVQDSNNVVVPGATVNFTSDSGVLSAGSVTTDAGGAAQTVIGAGGDSTPRTITVTATSEGASSSIEVSLVNAQLTINGPTEVFANVITEYVVQLSDDSGNPIAGQTVTLDSIAGNELDFSQRTTNAQGQATFRYTASEFGQDELVATGFGETTSLDIEIGIDIATIGLFTSTPTLGSDGVERADITAIVQDSGGRVVAGALVSISADTGDIAQSDPQTDPNGRVEATLGTAGNPTNRVITVTASAGFAEETVTVEVKGTRIELSGPVNVVANQQVQYVARLLDSGDNGVPGEAVEFVSTAGNTLSAASVVTDSTGEARVNLTGTQFGPDTLTATSLGEVANIDLDVSQDAFTFVAPATDTEIPLTVNTGVTVEWLVDGAPQTGQTVNIFTTRGTLSANSVVLDGNGRGTVQISSTSSGQALLTAVNSGGTQISRSVEFVATTPASLDLQASQFIVAPGEQSTVRATVRDASGNLVKNQLINFLLRDETGGQLSSGGDITNSNGQAETTYTAGNAAGASGAAVVTAEVVSNPAVNDSVELTVAGQEVFISLGTGNEIFEPDTTTYEQPWTVFVTDVEGRGVPGASVDVSVLSLRFIKGQYVAGTDLWQPTPSATCFDEDTKFCSDFQEPNGDSRCRNGRLDPGEDDPLVVNPDGPGQGAVPIGNGSGQIEAGNVASLSAGTLTTDSAGRADFRLIYQQVYGNWVEVRLRVKTAVAGTEFSKTQDFTLPVTVDDLELDAAPPGLGEGSVASPWGTKPGCEVKPSEG